LYPRKFHDFSPNTTIIVGVTGASGAIFAQKTLALLEDDPRVTRVYLVVTETGLRLLAEELEITSGDLRQLPSRILGRASQKIATISNKDVGASIASGSYDVHAMIVVPCTMGALAAIANGASDDLVARSADVMLKESRKLILCVRDTPFNRIHLENMLRAQQAARSSCRWYRRFITNRKRLTMCHAICLPRPGARGLPQEKMYRWTGRAPAKKAAP